MLLKQTRVALSALILTLVTLHTYGRPLQIHYFFSRSFIPDALKIDYNVQEERRIYYNVTAFRPFPGRLLMNFFIRQYGAKKGMPSRDFLKRSNLDFCKTLETLRNLTSEKRVKPFLLQDTFVTSCPLVNGFYYIRNGIIPSVYVPAHMELGRYVVHFELIQVIDELVKLMNLRFVVIVEEGDNAAAAAEDDSGEGGDNYEDNDEDNDDGEGGDNYEDNDEDNDDDDGHQNEDQHGDDDDSDGGGSNEDGNDKSNNDSNDDNDDSNDEKGDQDDKNDDHADDNDSDDHNNEGRNEGNNDSIANDNNDEDDNNASNDNNDNNEDNDESNGSGDNNNNNTSGNNDSGANDDNNYNNSEQYV